jgi:hypothetical protein
VGTSLGLFMHPILGLLVSPILSRNLSWRRMYSKRDMRNGTP